MTEGKHTPGPWAYFVGNANGRGLIRIETAADHPTEAGIHIASMVRGAQSEANARLMTAAPDLLKALRDMVAIATDRWRSLPTDSHEKVTLNNARAAIAKAEGR